MKILYVATSDVHIHTFHLPYIKWLQENDYEVHLAIENRGNHIFEFADKIFYLPFPRSLCNTNIINTFLRLKSVIDRNNYDLIHCHTPIPSMLTRIASIKARKKGARVLYTAHGFHFYKGASIKNWLLYYSSEWLLSFFTDCIITINREDYQLAKSKLKSEEIFHINGIGVDHKKFIKREPEERMKIREKLGLLKDDFILLYVAEFIPRKNHKFIIDSIPKLLENIPELKVLFIGKGILFEKCKNYANELDVHNCLKFLGFRSDVDLFASIADIGISSSRQEGLGLGIVEQMSCAVPVVASMDRGHKELIEEGINGYLFPQNDGSTFINSILKLYQNPSLREKMGLEGHKKAQEFSIENSLESISRIYSNNLK